MHLRESERERVGATGGSSHSPPLSYSALFPVPICLIISSSFGLLIHPKPLAACSLQTPAAAQALRLQVS